MGIFDHVGLSVSDLSRSAAFYDAALAPLGIRERMRIPNAVTQRGDVIGYGSTKPEFWLSGGPKTVPHVHLAFVAATRAAVDEFHAAALAAGGTENGPPGLRAHYHPDYYGAFVLDPDGHNIEACCHLPG
jgi:catechol 2,3-dioxygenase-like lactoylglutathione lyase family enzyme